MKKIGILLALFICIPSIYAQPAGEIQFELNTRKKGAAIHPTMYGLFFEDINFGADGGLYAELVKNRSFDFPQTFMGWNTFGNVKVRTDNSPFDKNPTYLQFSVASHHEKRTGIENEGFRGMGFQKNAEYRFSVWAKRESQDEQKLRVELISSDNNILAHGDVTVNTDDWKQYEIVLKPKVGDVKGHLRIFFTSGGSVCIDHVSLFPIDTWKGRINGMRKDLVETLADLNPGVLRFPGGCIVEGTDLETRYNWKNSVGQVENRPLNENRWNYTFRDRLTPDYYQTYGMGFYDFFLLSEDLGAEPLPVVNVGLACQYQNKHEHCHVSVGELGDYVQDALDLIEFANGDVNTTWGKIRAEMGHLEPFNLKYLGVGNEQWGSEYPVRLEVFIKAIRVKYPEIQIIGSSGPSPNGKEFDYLWPEMKRLKVNLVDEHYYKDPQWFLNNAARYDAYDRKAPAVFAGEYACHAKVPNSFESALCEAAFMTGLERNADIVHMCTYAPLFAHQGAWQWRTNMIWFDNLRMMKTPNYYVQQLYGQNAGTHVMPLTWNKQSVSGQEGLYASATFDANRNCYILKVANVNNQPRSINVQLIGLKKNTVLSVGECTLLEADSLDTINTLDVENIAPKKASAQINETEVSIRMSANSFGVYNIELN